MYNMTTNMMIACNIVWALAQYQAEFEGNFDMISDFTVAKAEYKSSGKLKDLDIFRNDIIQLNTIMVNALKDWDLRIASEKLAETFDNAMKNKENADDETIQESREKS